MKFTIDTDEKSLAFISGILQSNFLLLEYINVLGTEVVVDVMREVNKIGVDLDKQLEKNNESK